VADSKVGKNKPQRALGFFAVFAKSDLLTINFAFLCASFLFFAVKMTFVTSSDKESAEFLYPMLSARFFAC
jgi:hypothetical protein